MSLTAVGGWWRLAVGGWRLAVGGPWALSLTAVLDRKQWCFLRTALACLCTSACACVQTARPQPRPTTTEIQNSPTHQVGNRQHPGDVLTAGGSEPDGFYGEF